jgi:two-component system phosphate regulon sensor histidine kinase PhoR
LAERKIQWKLFYLFSAFSVIPLFILAAIIYSSFKNTYFENYLKVLESDTRLICERINADTSLTRYVEIAAEYDKKTGVRVTIIDTTGTVLADSRHNAASMDNHSNRPEVIDALKGKSASWHRFSFTLTDDMLYAAMPVFNKSGRVYLVVRTAINTKIIEASLTKTRNEIFAGAAIISLFLLMIMFVVINNLIKPIFDIRSGADRFSKGLFGQKIFPPRDQTLRSIAESLNRMASQLDEKLGIIEEQGNIQQAVLISMKEGIIAVDHDERILLLNQTAKAFLGISSEEFRGKTLQEAVRNSEIQKFFKLVAAEENTQETEIILQTGKDKSLQLTGTRLLDFKNNSIGSLVVLNDITNIKYLDAIKKDLVANVSHELKTPVTTIKGFIETLRDGALDDRKNAERFLDIVLKHIERLNLIIDDLLTLAKLEQSGGAEIEMKLQRIKPVIESVAEDFEVKAEQKKIEINIKCSEELTGKFNRHLLEQAIGNLLDNAIKYSDKKSTIEIGALIEDNELNIYVDDEGYGISEEHIPRLFERFYRIDKARSREEGGTGLGLAIVKHLVNVHGGNVTVESNPGKGSIFTIKLPAAI